VQAKENLLALREQCLKTMEATQANGSKSGKEPAVEPAPAYTAEQRLDAALQSFINALEQTPLCDPTLPAWLRDALEKSGTNSSYVVREAYRLFALIEEGVKRRASEWMEQAGEENYRLRLIAALGAFEKQDWPRVLRLVRATGDQNPADLYVERVRMHAGEKVARSGCGARESVCGAGGIPEEQLLHRAMGEPGDWLMGSGDRKNRERIFVLPGAIATCGRECTRTAS